MTADKINAIQKCIALDLQNKTLSDTGMELSKTTKILKENLMLHAKDLMRESRANVSVYTPPIPSQEIEHYASAELKANIKMGWLKNQEMEENLIKIIVLRNTLFLKRANRIKELEAEDTPSSKELQGLQFDQLRGHITELSRNAEYIIRKYSHLNGRGLPKALEIALKWQEKKEALNLFLKDNPPFSRRPELSTIAKLEFLEFRIALLAIEGWLNHTYLDELKNDTGQSLNSEEIAKVRLAMYKCFPLLKFTLSKELDEALRP